MKNKYRYIPGVLRRSVLRVILPVVALLLLVIDTPALALQQAMPTTRQITDMMGRSVTVPINVSKVLSIMPPPTTFVYMLAPEKLGGWVGMGMSGRAGNKSKFIPEKYRSIPVFSWDRNAVNYEAYISAQPDLVFLPCEENMGMNLQKIEQIQAKMGEIPVVCVKNSINATGYGETITFMADLLGVPGRGRLLNDFYQRLLQEVKGRVADIPAEKRTRAYYAEKNNGLATDPSGSWHSQLIDVCGGINVADCAVSSGQGMTPVTMESILVWQPQLIITTSSEFLEHARHDASWQKIPAVRNNLVYLTPSDPMNWFDRPPGVNRIVGIAWGAHLLYPQLFDTAWLHDRVGQFYTLFYHYELTEGEMKELLME